MAVILNGPEPSVFIEVNAWEQQLDYYNGKGEKLNPELFKKPGQKQDENNEKPNVKPQSRKRRPGKGRGI